MNLADKTALVTGASSGIGRAVAESLAAAGTRVFVTARRKDRLLELASEHEPGQIIPVVEDLGAPGAPERLFDAVTEDGDGCDILVHCAGTMHAGDIQNLDLDDVSEMVRTNLDVATRISYVALRHFQTRGSGALIQISSILGTKVRAGVGAYAATKHGIEALCESLRMEVAGTGLSVSVIQPGLTETELQDHFDEHPRDALGIDELLAPEDVARCVRFVLEQPTHVRIPVLMVLPSQQAM